MTDTTAHTADNRASRFRWGKACRAALHRAAALSDDYTRRHGIPQGSDTAPDLDDQASLGLETGRGYSLAGRLTQEEAIAGTAPPLATFWGTLTPLMLAATALLSLFAPVWVAALPGLLWLALGLSSVGFTGGIVLGGLGWALILSAPSLMPLPFGQSPGAVRYSLGVTLTVLSLLAVPLAAWMSRISRDSVLIEDAYGGAIVLSNTRQSEARREQGERAARDTSPLIELGTSQGFAWERGDVMAPDPGKTIGLTANDLSTGLLVLGAPGTGKTSGVLRPVLHQWVQHECGGVLVSDGKGQLPREMADAGLVDLLSPGSGAVVPLIAGLNAEEVTGVLLAGGSTDGGDSDWQAAAERMLRHAALLVELATQAGPVRWTLANIERATADADYRTELLALLDENESAVDDMGLLSTVRGYWLGEYPQVSQASGYVASVFGIVSAWLSPLTGHRDLREWTQSDEGIDPTAVLEGARYGIGVDAAIHGDMATSAVVGFIKQRIYNAATRRGDGWAGQTAQTAALIMMDEADALLDDRDAAIVPRGRSLGLRFVVGVQTIEQLEAQFGGMSGSPKAHGLLGQFRSVVALASTERTAELVQQRGGYGHVLEPVAITSVPDLRYTVLQRLSASPMNDPEHPSRGPLMRSASGKVIGRALGSMFDHNTDAGERLTLSDEPEPWFSTADVQTLTSTPGIAVAVLNRAGAPRRDAIKLHPIF